ncbi:hypothetical protein D0Y65_038102 [Glycine soja]|uniref:Telomere length regulation protein conserved domain-containing protein n=1 Tax=Glycine soja TaxID=3848 RepID=A0A445H3H8_GLYSO|nr:hypothetical protein D0Y65_038102 [Glycine soja]
MGRSDHPKIPEANPQPPLRLRPQECPPQQLVERAINVAEKLIRASPDELKHAARDMTRTLVQVRCSDIALEGAEESTEDKRQRSLVALVVTCPFESLESLNNLLYSPNVDISQRIMILDVMTEAAQELAE